MGIIDFPSPYLSNVAIFKQQVKLPRGRGGTRRFKVPKIEEEVLGISNGDEMSVEIYDPQSDKQIEFDTELKSESRFTIPLREIDLKDSEFDSGTYHQIVLTKKQVLDRLRSIPPRRIYDTTTYKATPAGELNADRDTDSSLTMSIRTPYRDTENITGGEEIYVTLARISSGFDDRAEQLQDRLTSVNRDVFKTKATDLSDGTSQFQIPAERRRVKDYQTDDVFQVAIRKA